MDIKFHITKIINSGSGVYEWTAFIDQLKQKKCDRDLLIQVYTIALNNIKEKRSKQHRKLLVGLANLQSEISIETARETFEDAFGLDSDCAVVCVYLAQFEHHHSTSGKACQVLRDGKCDGRAPKFLIKNAYKNLKDNKSNLFDGIPDPWDETLYDVTDTSTITNKKTKAMLQGTLDFNATTISRTVLKPTRSCMPASSLLKESQPISPRKEVAEKIQLINEFGSKCPKDNDVFLAKPQRFQSDQLLDEGEEENCGPTLSPFMKVYTTPLVSKKSFALTGNTPNGFMLGYQSSNTKDNNPYNTELNFSDIVDGSSSLNEDEKTTIEQPKQSSKNSIANKFQTPKSPSIIEIPQNGVKKLFFEPEKLNSNVHLNKSKHSVFEENKDNNDEDFNPLGLDKIAKIGILPNKYDNGSYKTPLKETISNRTVTHTPKVFISARKPLTEIKLQPKSKPAPSSSHLIRYPTTTKNTKEIVSMQSGLPELIQSINLLKDSQSLKKMRDKPTKSINLKTTTANSCSRDLFKIPQKENQNLSELDKNTFVPTEQRIPNDNNSTVSMHASIETKLASNERLLLSSSKKEKQFLHPQKQNNNRYDIPDAPKTQSKNTNSLNAKAASSTLNSVNKTPNLEPRNNGNRIPLQIVSDRAIKNTTPQVKGTSALRINKNTIKGTPILASERLQSRSRPTYPCEKLDNKKKCDIEMNKILEKGLKTLEMNGYNVDSQLKPIPQQQNSRHFVLNGKYYEQIKCIGKGGSGKVFDVIDENKYHYAMKRVKLEDLDDCMIDCHINEIQLLTKMKDSPCIIQMFDWEKTEEHLLLLMEKGDIDLAHVLRSYKNMSIEKIKVYWQQLLQAVQVIHRLGIIHADLKPANFLFVGSALKLIDFGISNSLQADKTSLTREYQMGTLNYMPPEALMAFATPNESTTPRISRASDVWSLGCMLYLMVYNKTPYQYEKNQHMKMIAIKQGHPINYSQIDDANLLDCLQGCLKHNKRDRYTIDQLLMHPFLRT